MNIPLAYIGLGSNLGDRVKNLSAAVAYMKSEGIEISRSSSIYETDPVGIVNQPRFLNQVVEARPFLSPLGSGGSPPHSRLAGPGEILAALLDIECRMGRVRTGPGAIKGGPRIIDLDLLLYDDLVINSGDDGESHDSGLGPEGVTADCTISLPRAPRLIVPHPRLHLRRFVLTPLVEIAPNLLHPVLHKTMPELLCVVDDGNEVNRLESN